MLKVGQHVVLINDRFASLVAVTRPNLPSRGVVYTIRDIFESRTRFGAGEPQCLLVEIVNPPIWSTVLKKKVEPSFMVSRFRPLVKLTTKSFTTDLTPVDHLELNLEYQGIKA